MKKLHKKKLLVKKTKEKYCLPVKYIFYGRHIPYWCALKYPNHPKGCPNFGKRDKCPPKAPYVKDLLDFKKPVYIVYKKFNLEKHVEKMRKRHPDWTERQLRNCLYWQRRPKNILKKRAIKISKKLGLNSIVLLPEAAGIQVYLTCKYSGLILEPIKKLKIVHFVAFIGNKP